MQHVQGIRKTHTQFQYAPYMNMSGTRALHGWSAIGDASNSDDCLGHGTHVSGSVGGLTYGVAKNATLWAGTFSLFGQVTIVFVAELCYGYCSPVIMLHC